MAASEYRPELDPALDVARGNSPIFRYALFSQQRSGSNWLGTRLSNLGTLGIPGEYLNPRFLPMIAQRLGVSGEAGGLDIRLYLARVERARTSENGRFGVKIQPNQLFPMCQGDLQVAANFLSRYDAIVVLTRRDRLRQAASGAIAELTRDWIADGREPDVSGLDREELMCDVAAKLARFTSEERQMRAVVQATGRPVHSLTYEQMVADPDGTLNAVARFLGHQHGEGDGSEQARPLKVPSPPLGAVREQVRAMFLDYIDGREPRGSGM